MLAIIIVNAASSKVLLNCILFTSTSGLTHQQSSVSWLWDFCFKQQRNIPIACVSKQFIDRCKTMTSLKVLFLSSKLSVGKLSLQFVQLWLCLKCTLKLSEVWVERPYFITYGQRGQSQSILVSYRTTKCSTWITAWGCVDLRALSLWVPIRILDAILHISRQ